MHIYQNSSSGTIILFSSNLQYKIVFLVNPPLLILERSIRKIIFQKKKLGLMIANAFRITSG